MRWVAAISVVIVLLLIKSIFDQFLGFKAGGGALLSGITVGVIFGVAALVFKSRIFKVNREKSEKDEKPTRPLLNKIANVTLILMIVVTVVIYGFLLFNADAVKEANKNIPSHIGDKLKSYINNPQTSVKLQANDSKQDIDNLFTTHEDENSKQQVSENIPDERTVQDRMAMQLYKNFPTVAGLSERNRYSSDFKFLAFFFNMATDRCEPARYWLEELYNQDNEYGAEIYGIAYANGDCFNKSKELSEMYLTSCASKSISCKISLLNLYKKFNNMPKKRFLLASELALLGYYFTQLDLAECYLSGIGTVLDYEKALLWMYIGLADAPNAEIRNAVALEIKSLESSMSKKMIATIKNKSKMLRQTIQKNIDARPQPTEKNEMGIEVLKNVKQSDYLYMVLPRDSDIDTFVGSISIPTAK
ncbi:MAG: hypothetical protein LBT70_05365 [Holosporaceae bacterium]|jgi:uncharacterized membrane protein YidH (DUF202 family)|nr:hypothetical protein [Holosporaceae bacterium]